jgi:hypothetical protein
VYVAEPQLTLDRDVGRDVEVDAVEQEAARADADVETVTSRAELAQFIAMVGAGSFQAVQNLDECMRLPIGTERDARNDRVDCVASRGDAFEVPALKEPAALAEAVVHCRLPDRAEGLEHGRSVVTASRQQPTGQRTQVPATMAR